MRSSKYRYPAPPRRLPRPGACAGQGASPYQVVRSAVSTSAPPGCTMHSPVPSSSRKGCSERPEFTVLQLVRRLPGGPLLVRFWMR